MVLRSPFPDVQIPDVALSEYILNYLKHYGDAVAIIDGGNNDKTYTFREVHDNAIACAKSLAKLGVKEGDVVMLCCTNCAEYVFFMIGVFACGATVTTCNPNYTKVEILSQSKRTKPKLVLLNADQSKTLKEVATDVKSIKYLVGIEDKSDCMSYSDFLLQGRLQALPNVKSMDRNNTALILFSSGTTGLPKGVMLSQRNIVFLLAILRIAIRRSRLDVEYLVLPMFHIFGVGGSLNILAQGARLVLKKRFDFVQLLQDIGKYRITAFCAAPPIVVALDQLPSGNKYDTSSLRLIACGAAPLAENVGKSVAGKLNVQVHQLYGLTEAAPATTTVDGIAPITSVGVVSPNTLLKVVDGESGKELGPNEKGELWVKGPQVMKGYFENPAATAACLDADGWLRTGDIGYYDTEEHLYIVDRLKELIKYKGFQVAPAELEDALLGHPQIVDAGVIGVPDILAGELPKAFVVRKNATLRAEDIHEFLKGRIAKYKYLRGGISFVDAIPKNPSGKILRRELREKEKRIRSKY